MKCPKCQSEVPERFKFCPECGTSVSKVSGQSDAEGLSLGAQPTMAGAAAGQASLGDQRTMAGPGAEKTAPGGTGTPLAERYEVLEELGRGGFAVVSRARDRKLDRVVAVKRLLADKLEGSGAKQTLERFRREAHAIAALNHRNIVAVFDCDRDAEGDYIVMEYVAGGTLRDYLKKTGGKLPADEAVALVQGIGQGLAYAHKRNLIHRDIKPANVLLQPDGGERVPKIVDFGLARLGSDSELSVSGYGLGTPYYMPPEQRRDAKSVNHTADIYALGKTL